MAKFRFRDMIIEISRTVTGNIIGQVINPDDLSSEKVKNMNKHLEMLIDSFTPEPGTFSTSTTNAIANWIVNGLGKDAEIIEYDIVNHDPDVIY